MKYLHLALTALALTLLTAPGGCSGSAQNFGFVPVDSDASVGSGDDGAPSSPPPGSSGSIVITGDGATPPPPCTGAGLRCMVNRNCNSTTPTTITGTVYDPAGKNPVYNAVVFVPADPGQLPAITPGTHSCNTCDATIGDYVAATKTDAKGSFTLTNVPTGAGIPLAVQIGKWRRVISVSTSDCATVTAPAALTRLPRNRSEGDMPQMALLTGGLDNLGCFLRGVGVDAGEYSAPHAGGRLDVYQGLSSLLGLPIGNGPGLSGGGAGDCTKAGCPLWSTRPDLENYDIVLLACEGGENNQTKPPAAMTAMHDWLDEGGKVFATHFHYTWFKNGPSDFQGVATWLGSSAGLGAGVYNLDSSFFKGQVFHDWLAGVGALSGNTIALNSVATSVSTVQAPTVRWIYDPATTPQDVKYLSFGTPVGGALEDGGELRGYCGKAVFTDLHAGGAPAGDVPNACSGADLSPQEKALEFLFFDLSACVSDDSTPPPPPPPPMAR